MSIKKLVSATLIVVLTSIFWIPDKAQALELPVKAESAILLDAHSGKVLYEKDPHKVLTPASVTKLMTMVIVMEAIKEGKVALTDKVIASPNAASYGGSQIYLAPGETLTLKDLLLGIALASGNDASVAVAEHVAGTHEAFVELMNKKAQELGLKNTNFVNCNGLEDPNHYTTAYDLAQIALYALRYPEIREICSVKHYRIRTETNKPFQYDNKNKLLWQYPGTDGFKTGWTTTAKYCLAATVERNGLRFISVVMASPEKSGHFADTKIIWNWGYSQFNFKQFFKENEVIGQVAVGKGEKDTVAAIPEKKVGITLAKGQDKDLTTKIELIPLVNAPLQAGQTLGHVSIVNNKGEVLDRVRLIAQAEIKKGSWWQEFSKVLRGVVTN